MVGFIIRPIIAALFLTAWDLYGPELRSLLPEAPTDPVETAAGADEGSFPERPPEELGRALAPRRDAAGRRAETR